MSLTYPSDPIEAVACSYITELKADIPIEKQRAALDVLCRLLRDELSREEATALVHQHLRTKRPAERLIVLLSIGADPIPYSGEDPPQLGMSRQKARNWTECEDQRLIAGIRRHGIDNWNLVSTFVGNGRTRSQCSQRWNRGLNPLIFKGPWTYREEANLIRLVGQYGEKSWRRVATEIGNRSDVQCRYHFRQMQRVRTIDGTHTGVPVQPDDDDDVKVETNPRINIEDLCDFSIATSTDDILRDTGYEPALAGFEGEKLCGYD
jgi:hypothetical protein